MEVICGDDSHCDDGHCETRRSNVGQYCDAILKLNTNNETSYGTDPEMLSATEDNDSKNLGVENLSEDELRNILDQITDHNLPDSKKCPLVRRLNENAKLESKEESCFALYPSTSSGRNNGRKSRHSYKGSKDAEFMRGRVGNIGNINKKVHSSQSLQDLACTCLSACVCGVISMRSVGANRSTKRLNKTSRANSFTMPSGGTHNFCTNSGVNKDPDPNIASSHDPSSDSLSSNKATLSVKTNRNKTVKMRPSPSYISSNTSVVSELISDTNSSAAINSNDCDYETGVICTDTVSPATSSSRVYQECYATQTVHYEHKDLQSDSCDTGTSKCNTTIHAKQWFTDDESGGIEMHELGKPFNIIEYNRHNSDLTDNASSLQQQRSVNYGTVDSFMDMIPLTSRVIETTPNTDIAKRVFNCNAEPAYGNERQKPEECRTLQTIAGRDECDAIKGYPNENCFNTIDKDLPQNFQNLYTQNHSKMESNTQNNGRDVKKKKKTLEEKMIMAEDIEGHVGDKPIEFLLNYVNSGENNLKNDENFKNTVCMTQLKSVNANGKDNAKRKDKLNHSMGSNGNGSAKKRSSNGTALQGVFNVNSNLNRNTASNDIPSSSASSCNSDDTSISMNKHPNIAQVTNDSLCCDSSLVYSSELKEKLHNTNNTIVKKQDNSGVNKSSHLPLSPFAMGRGLSDDEYCYALSDSEMHDRETGFIVPKSKHLRRRKGGLKRMDNFRGHHSANPSARSSASTTPSLSSSTMSGTGAVARGYESEREYSTEEFRRRQEILRRKSTSSVPHSEQNSAYNSDGELSSHSMPIRNDTQTNTSRDSHSRSQTESVSSTPRASYADIAKSFNSSSNTFSGSKRQSADCTHNSSSLCDEYPHLDLSVSSASSVTNESIKCESSPKAPLKATESLTSPKLTLQMSALELSDTICAPSSVMKNALPQSIANRDDPVYDPQKSHSTICNPHKLSDVPAVIMCDYSATIPVSDVCSVTFGFFDDINSTSEINESSGIVNSVSDNASTNEMRKSQTDTSPLIVEIEQNVSYRPYQPLLKISDVDKRSFNYEQIINYVRKAWDNVKIDQHKGFHENQIKYYES